jgi:asparagine synthase (glutamine-hydrolysing)
VARPNLQPSAINNILTLRYNPTKQSLIPKLTWRDFIEKKYHAEPSDFVENSITSHLKSAVGISAKTRVSLALSSGVDSTLVLAMLKKSCPDVKINAISVKFAQSTDESKDAAKLAQKFGADHHILYLENYLRELPKAINIIKLPFWDLHWYHIVKKAKSLSKILVSGDGGDELFGGYTFRYRKFLSLTRTSSLPLTKTKAYLQCHERDWVPDQEKLFGKKAKFNWKNIHKTILPYFDNPLSSLSQVFLADFNGKLLYNWLPLNTTFHTYFGITPITPILTKKVISFATHLPNSLKYDKKNNVGKLVLREILHKHSLDKLLSKKKQGFSVDTVNLWKSHGYELCKYYLDDAYIVKTDLISKEWILKHLNRNISDVRYVNKFLGLLALEIWHRLFITKEMKPTTTLS